MGLEAVCRCSIDEVNAEVKAHLEARELILRAPFRRTIAIADMRDVEAAGGQLRFRIGPSAIVLQLGQEAAAKWARKIATPPPGLAQKLGIGHASRAFVIGKIDEPVLLDALDGHAGEPGVAKVSLAIVRDDEDLRQAVVLHETEMGNAPIWLVYGKGPSAVFEEAQVRRAMRERGYRDTKVSAVSAALSAMRYATT